MRCILGNLAAAIVFGLILGPAQILLSVSAIANVRYCNVYNASAFAGSRAEITAATVVPATIDSPQYCRIDGTLTTRGEGAGRNTARFRVSLPFTWNQKFLFLGGGGFDGSIPNANPAHLGKGYAVAGTDSGHVASSDYPDPGLDASWAIKKNGRPDKAKLADYHYRSRHQVGVMARRIVEKYYGSDIAYSYFSGCSNGGYEAMAQAMRYPTDYDGIVAGDAASDKPGNELWSLRNIKAFADHDAWIPPSAFEAIGEAVFAQCDAIDGVADKLIQNPAMCAFDPDILVPDTLTQPQADALRTYFEAVRDPRGRLVFPGSSVAGLGITDFRTMGLHAHESPLIGTFPPTPVPFPDGPQPWGNLIAGSVDWILTFGAMAYLGYHDPEINLMDDAVINKQGEARKAAARLLYKRFDRGLADDPSDLESFIKNDRKLIIYDGYADTVVNPYKKVLFYRDLAEMYGGYREVGKNVRLFMFPDMQHCAGGTGPSSSDSLTAIEEWVEQGKSPDYLMASGGNPQRTMPVCMFPRQAEYSGSGDVHDGANWSCPPNKKLLELGVNGLEAGLSPNEDRF